jgi:hypothetical protein
VWDLRDRRKTTERPKEIYKSFGLRGKLLIHIETRHIAGTRLRGCPTGTKENILQLCFYLIEERAP